MSEFLTRVAAANASSAAAFPLGVVADGSTLRVNTARGAFDLEFPAPEEPRRFAPFDPVLRSVGEPAARGFAEDLAEWLGVVAVGPPERTGPVRLHAVDLGEGLEGAGARWRAFKLFLAGDEAEEDESGYAEIFLRLTPDRTQAQLLEKWSAYRPRLPGLFERALGLPARRWVDGPELELRPGEEAAWFHDAIGFAVPPGWGRTELPGGSTKLVDPTDEFGFEVSRLEVPPVDVVTLLSLMVEADPKARGASARPLSHRGGLELATAEHAWCDRDPHRPADAPEREARCRWLVARARSGWTAFVTFVFWTDDAAVALPHWDRMVESLCLRRGARLEPDLSGHGRG